MTSALHPHRRPEAHWAAPCPHEIEAWISEVRPVVHALRSRSGTVASPGLERWLVEQVDLATEAVDILDCESFEAEAAGGPCEELGWLHTQVSALLEGLRRVERSGSVAA